MKTTKRFLLTLAAMIGMTGAWAQDPIDLTPNADGTEWTLAATPAYDVELQVDYEPGFDLTVGESLHGTVAFT